MATEGEGEDNWWLASAVDRLPAQGSGDGAASQGIDGIRNVELTGSGRVRSEGNASTFYEGHRKHGARGGKSDRAVERDIGISVKNHIVDGAVGGRDRDLSVQ